MAAIKVKGMSCGHCAAAVTKALNNLDGVTDVQVDLGSGRVTYEIEAPIPLEEIVRAVKAAGYEVD